MLAYILLAHHLGKEVKEWGKISRVDDIRLLFRVLLQIVES